MAVLPLTAKDMEYEPLRQYNCCPIVGRHLTGYLVVLCHARLLYC